MFSVATSLMPSLCDKNKRRCYSVMWRVRSRGVCIHTRIKPYKTLQTTNYEKYPSQCTKRVGGFKHGFTRGKVEVFTIPEDLVCVLIMQF